MEIDESEGGVGTVNVEVGLPTKLPRASVRPKDTYEELWCGAGGRPSATPGGASGIVLPIRRITLVTLPKTPPPVVSMMESAGRRSLGEELTVGDTENTAPVFEMIVGLIVLEDDLGDDPRVGSMSECSSCVVLGSSFRVRVAKGGFVERTIAELVGALAINAPPS